MTDTFTQANPMKTALNAVQPQNTLLNASTIASIVSTVVTKFAGVDLAQHRNDPNLVQYVCQLVESAFPDAKTAKICKKEQVMKVMSIIIVGLSAIDISAIDKIIEFVHSNKQIAEFEEVVKVAKPLLKRIARFFLKKLG